jgi:hypothetical protein
MRNAKHPELVACTEVLEVKDAAYQKQHTSTGSVCCNFSINFVYGVFIFLTKII